VREEIEKIWLFTKNNSSDFCWNKNFKTIFAKI
jgi:hypothetical protein